MLTLIPIEDRAKYIPIVKIGPETGNCNAYMTAKSAARSLTCDEAKAKSYSQKIIEASLSGEMFLGHYWRRGELLIAPEGYINGQSLVGREINGYVVKEDTGRVLPTGERLFICECTRCSATRVFNEHALSFGVMPKCGCVHSFDLLAKSEAIQHPMEVDDIRESILSSRKDHETLKSAPAEERSNNVSNSFSWVKHFQLTPALAKLEPVLQYSKDGKQLLGEFQSSRHAFLEVCVREAMRIGKVISKTGFRVIDRCCQGLAVSAFGYKWVYANAAESEKRNILSRRNNRTGRKNILMFDMNKKFLARFDSSLTAYRALHPEEARTLSKSELQIRARGILDCCWGILDSFGGFVWTFADKDIVPNVRETHDIEYAINRIAEAIDETLGEEPIAPKCEGKVE